jgi:hypothetical protein
LRFDFAKDGVLVTASDDGFHYDGTDMRNCMGCMGCMGMERHEKGSCLCLPGVLFLDFFSLLDLVDWKE